MDKFKNSLFSNEENFSNWISKSEPHLVKNLYNHFLKEDVDVSFDSEENKRRIDKVELRFKETVTEIYNSFSRPEKLILYLMQNSFGWLAFEDIETLSGLISKFFDIPSKEIIEAIYCLLDKYIIFSYKRLNFCDFLYCPSIFLKYLFPFLKEEGFFKVVDAGIESENLLKDNYLQLIAGLISYIVNFSPRSSENNEIHRIDLEKLLEFFSDFAEKDKIERIIKKLTRFGFFQKYNNRIIINKFLFDTIIKLSVNEQFFIIFLYEFLDSIGLHKATFISLKILSHYYLIYRRPMLLKELFFYYLNACLYFYQRTEVKFSTIIKHEEIKFLSLIKQLENHKIAQIKREKNSTISLNSDSIIMNEPIISLLNDVDLSVNFKRNSFIIDSNFEIIVEPDIKPEVLFKIALIAEPKTIQVISIFKITEESLKKSLVYGLKKEEILSFLKEHSEHKLPENVEKNIEDFFKEVEFEELKNYRIIQLNAHFSHLIREKYKEHVIEIEPHTFLIFDEETLKDIEENLMQKKIPLKFVTDFLGEKYHSLVTKFQLEHNIKHLHTIKDFFDFYGSQHIGNILKIDNKI